MAKKCLLTVDDMAIQQKVSEKLGYGSAASYSMFVAESNDADYTETTVQTEAGKMGLSPVQRIE